MTLVKKLMLIALSCLFLAGCLGVDGPKVVIVDNNLQPAQIVDTTPIEVRYIDPATGKEVIINLEPIKSRLGLLP